MNLFSDKERVFAQAITRLIAENPFSPEWQNTEASILGEEYTPPLESWLAFPDMDTDPNGERIESRVERLMGRARMRLISEENPDSDDLAAYESLVTYYLLRRYTCTLRQYAHEKGKENKAHFYKDFSNDYNRFMTHKESQLRAENDPAHLFSCFYQMVRTFENITANVVGASPASQRTRAAIWQSVFTRDASRYRRALYRRMGDMTTLIEGLHGTGRRRISRAIGMSRYLAFDPVQLTFPNANEEAYLVLNLAGKTPEEIEAELFGAQWDTPEGVVDQPGLLATCDTLGAVLLDEIHLANLPLQIKLLTLMETHSYRPLGSTKTCSFRGRILAATSADLSQAVRDGRMRDDFFFRLCSDVVITPTVAEQTGGRPHELSNLVGLLATKVAGRTEGPRLRDEVMAVIESQLGLDYPWPGNLRELEQCVRQVLLKGSYQPRTAISGDPRQVMARDYVNGTVTAHDALSRYYTLVYAQCGSYLETSRRLEVDRRTVKSKIDPEFLKRLETVVNPKSL